MYNSSILLKADTDRFLPGLGPNFYSDIDTDCSEQSAVFRLFTIGLSLGSFQKISGWKLDPLHKVGRMLLLHRLAFEAEQAGKWHRADFFWRETLSGFRRLWLLPNIWARAAAALGETEASDGTMLRDRITRELLIDTHEAFVNERLSAGTPVTSGDRLFVHVGYLRDLLNLTGASPEQRLKFLRSAIEAETQALEIEKSWDAAAVLAQELVELDCSDMSAQERLAWIYFRRAVEDAPKGQEIEHARRVNRSIEDLERLRRTGVDRSLYFDLIGKLHHLRAILLANSGQLPEALVEARKSQDFCPSLEIAAQSLQQLIDAMKALQTRVEEVQNEVRSSSNKSLSPAGERMLRQAQRGFSSLNSYVASEEPAKIAAARQLAFAREVCRDIGLSDAGEARAVAVLDAVGSLYGSDAKTEQDLAALFQQRAAGSTELAGIDGGQVALFIARRRWENAAEKAGEETAKPDQAPEGEPPKHVQSIPPSERSRFSLEPFNYWLFSAQDKPARALLAAAVIVLIAAISGTGLEIIGSRERAPAYAAIVAADEQNDGKTVIAQAQRFLNAWSLHATDDRLGFVIKSYALQFNRWFAELSGSLTDADRAQINTYARLVGGTGSTER
jgi:hypothetical protein